MQLTKNTILNISKSIRFYVFPRLSTASLSTAYERAEGSNAVAEESGEKKREENEEEVAKDDPRKGVEGAEMVRESGKESMDGAWMAAQETPHKVRDNHNKA
ncbi:uncharacterized protein LOC114186095 [Vigna unguiculata]|uniref:Uncharacterized protein n=1 Tax=Vigna unguiculata TaxID=3917 RepID=A0A4D6N890_VIGUN|nr:uncharacterized protein LOC114186095 [Vigna unguiculata]QCE09976.1 hypothetical protein DEO72_LG10g1199 [Vigna unguiculata]